MTATDVPFFNRVRNDSREFLHDGSEYNVTQSMDWFAKTSPEYYILIIDGVDVGYFRTSNKMIKSIHIGLDIAIAFRGRGYSVPAYEYFIKFLSDKYGISRYYLCVLEHNARAKHIYESLGFSVIRKGYNSDRKCGEYHMMLQYKNPEDVVNDDTHYIIEQSFNTLKTHDKSTILITGINGFIGRWLYEVYTMLVNEYHFDINILCVDISPNPPEWFNQSQRRIYYMQCDISDSACIDNLFFKLNILNLQCPVSYIFNCAGIANPSQYMKLPIQTLDVSYSGTKNIIEKIAAYFKIKSTILFSSSEIYGDPPDASIPTPETYVGAVRPDGTRSCYDIGKLVLEVLGNIYSSNFNIKICRPFNLYGPLMNDNRIIPHICKNVVRNNPIQVYGNGTQTRTFCYISDAMCMILKLATDTMQSDVYNIGCPSPELSIHGVAKFSTTIYNSTSEISLIPYPDNYPHDEPMRRKPNIDKISSAINYYPVTDLRTGLTKTLKYYDSII